MHWRFIGFLVIPAFIGCGPANSALRPNPNSLKATIPFRAERPATPRQEFQYLSGVAYVYDNVIEVVVVEGFLEQRTPDRQLLDIRAGLATCDEFNRWDTRGLGPIKPIRALRLSDDGTVGDTLRFLVKDTRRHSLATHWLTFQLHGMLYHGEMGGWVEELRWLHDTTSSRASCTFR